jgi:hypothetical protein
VCVLSEDTVAKKKKKDVTEALDQAIAALEDVAMKLSLPDYISFLGQLYEHVETCREAARDDQKRKGG